MPTMTWVICKDSTDYLGEIYRFGPQVVCRYLKSQYKIVFH